MYPFIRDIFAEMGFFPSLITGTPLLYGGLDDESTSESLDLDTNILTAKSQVWFLQSCIDHSQGLMELWQQVIETVSEVELEYWLTNQKNIELKDKLTAKKRMSKRDCKA